LRLLYPRIYADIAENSSVTYKKKEIDQEIVSVAYENNTVNIGEDHYTPLFSKPLRVVVNVDETV
jgi:hypothetical protein